MSYQIYFGFAQGLKKIIIIPLGKIDFMRNLIETTENTLELKREKYLDNPERWAFSKYEGIKDSLLCSTASHHNEEVRRFYNLLAACSEKPITSGDALTPDIFSELLPGLEFITVPPERWNGEYYKEKMQTLYEVMRGRESEGISFDTKKLTEKQAANVVRLFSEFLDHDDRRLDVPKGHDYLASSDDGGYDWCEKCGAITWDDAQRCGRKKCPLIEEENT